jgi:phytol kinase
MAYATESMNAIMFMVIFLAVFITVEILQRQIKIKNEYSRKLAHVSSALVVVIMPYFLSRWVIVSLALFFALFLLVTRLTGFFQSIHKVGRDTLGEVYFPVGVALTAYFFLPNDLTAFQFGMLVLGLSDAVGGIIGHALGSRRTKLFGEKSIEGTSAFFLCTLGIFFILAPAKNMVFAGLLISLASSLLELVLDRGCDNLVLPVFSALLIKVITGI